MNNKEKWFRNILFILTWVTLNALSILFALGGRVKLITSSGAEVSGLPLAILIATALSILANVFIMRLPYKLLIALLISAVILIIGLSLIGSFQCPDRYGFCQTIGEFIDLFVPDQTPTPDHGPIRWDEQQAFLLREPMYVGSPVHYRRACPAPTTLFRRLPYTLWVYDTIAVFPPQRT